MKAQQDLSLACTAGLPGMVATLTGSGPASAGSVTLNRFCAWNIGERFAGEDDLDDWTSEVLKRLSAKFRSMSVIGFGRSGAPK